jgi:Hypothetical methyltransferase.
MGGTGFRCRACHSTDGEVVLDLGHQPSWDRMPPASDRMPDPRYALRMWWCRDCWLAQLMEDAEGVEEVAGLEPQAMLDQTELSITRMHELGLLAPPRPSSSSAARTASRGARGWQSVGSSSRARGLRISFWTSTACCTRPTRRPRCCDGYRRSPPTAPSSCSC